MSKGTINKLKIVAIAAIALVVVIVVLQNTQNVETKLLFLKVTMPNADLWLPNVIVGFATVLIAGQLYPVRTWADGLKKLCLRRRT